MMVWSCWKYVVLMMVLVHFCRAVELNCTLTRSGKLMTYGLDKSLLPENKSRCDFWWSNASDAVANHKDQLPLVMTNSLDTLQTAECYAELTWKAQCISEENYVNDFTANCSKSCTQNDWLHGDTGGHSVLWLLVLPGLTAAALIFLLYKHRKKICSGGTCSCSQCGGLYTNVKTQNTDPTPLGVVV